MAHDVDDEQAKKRTVEWKNGRPVPSTASESADEADEDEEDTEMRRHDANATTDE